MEKIREFYKGMSSDENTKYYRFQCDCLAPLDAMDISVESWGVKDKNKYFTISMYFIEKSLWNRLKYAWEIICGDWTWREFCVRKEDEKYLSDIFNPDKKYSELP